MTNLQRWLKKLEAWLTPTSDNQGALTIVVMSIGEPDEIIELRGLKPIGRRGTMAAVPERRTRKMITPGLGTTRRLDVSSRLIFSKKSRRQHVLAAGARSAHSVCTVPTEISNSVPEGRQNSTRPNRILSLDCSNALPLAGGTRVRCRLPRGEASGIQAGDSPAASIIRRGCFDPRKSHAGCDDAPGDQSTSGGQYFGPYSQSD